MRTFQRLYITLAGTVLILLTISLAVHAEPALRININSATAHELIQLKGIGPKKARRIIEYRRRHGPFKSIYELVLVKGIGEKTIQKNAHRLTLEP